MYSTWWPCPIQVNQQIGWGLCCLRIAMRDKLQHQRWSLIIYDFLTHHILQYVVPWTRRWLYSLKKLFWRHSKLRHWKFTAYRAKVYTIYPSYYTTKSHWEHLVGFVSIRSMPIHLIIHWKVWNAHIRKNMYNHVSKRGVLYQSTDNLFKVARMMQAIPLGLKWLQEYADWIFMQVFRLMSFHSTRISKSKDLTFLLIICSWKNLPYSRCQKTHLKNPRMRRTSG